MTWLLVDLDTGHVERAMAMKSRLIAWWKKAKKWEYYSDGNLSIMRLDQWKTWHTVKFGPTNGVIIRYVYVDSI